MKRVKRANQSKALISGRGRRAPHWARELTRLGLGVRGQCPSCDQWATLRNGLCGTCSSASLGQGSESVGNRPCSSPALATGHLGATG